MKISAEFVISAVGPQDFPRDGLAEVAMVGRSNVGKSSLINALVRQKIARTSAEPGKTRLANIYRVVRGGAPPFLLVDLPGYGYARRGRDGTVADFQAIVGAYFLAERPGRGPQRRGSETEWVEPDPGALLLIDTRHPGLENDREAWQWLRRAVPKAAIVGTKVDKLARGERIRALKSIESAFDDPVLPVSAATGEGLDELWKLIDRLANSRSPQTPPPRLPAHPSSPPGQTGPPPPQARKSPRR